MDLNYINTFDDLIAFNLFRIEKSTSIQRTKLIIKYGTAIIYAGIPLAIGLVTNTTFLYLLIPISALYGLRVFQKVWDSRIMRQIKEQLTETEAEDFVNIPRVLSLRPDAILSKSERASATYQYSAVYCAEKSKEHLFVIFKGGAGYAIPLNAIRHQVDDFLSLLQSRVSTRS